MSTLRQEERAKTIEEAMNLVLSSLRSHLPHTYGNPYGGDIEHHKKCVAEYCRLATLLAKLY